jgi:hypothetical protein
MQTVSRRERRRGVDDGGREAGDGLGVFAQNSSECARLGGLALTRPESCSGIPLQAAGQWLSTPHLAHRAVVVGLDPYWIRLLGVSPPRPRILLVWVLGQALDG